MTWHKSPFEVLNQNNCKLLVDVYWEQLSNKYTDPYKNTVYEQKWTQMWLDPNLSRKIKYG